MALDRVPGAAQLFFGGLFSLKRKDALKATNITHVVSALRLPLDDSLFQGYKHLVVEVDDVEEDDIIQHFPTSNVFIQQGLDGGGGVLVHCAMGKSRAPTLIIAYLLAHPLSASSSATQEPPTPETLLALLRQVRSFAEPNPGFMAQLNLYHRMGCPSTVDNHPLYQRWCYERRVQYSIALGQAPGIEDIAFGDEAAGEVTDSGKRAENSKAFRCRRCRTQLGTDACLVEHFPASSASPRNARNGRSGEAVETGRNTQPCAHIFLDPLSWMRAELSEGRLEGRLECPNGKCRQNVGKYAWQGMKCSCGQWVVPGISLAKGKVDEVARKAGGDGR